MIKVFFKNFEIQRFLIQSHLLYQLIFTKKLTPYCRPLHRNVSLLKLIILSMKIPKYLHKWQKCFLAKQWPLLHHTLKSPKSNSHPRCTQSTKEIHLRP